MISHERANKMAEEADWRDGMNSFRAQVMESLAIINEEIIKLNNKIKEMK